MLHSSNEHDAKTEKSESGQETPLKNHTASSSARAPLLPPFMLGFLQRVAARGFVGEMGVGPGAAAARGVVGGGCGQQKSKNLLSLENTNSQSQKSTHQDLSWGWGRPRSMQQHVVVLASTSGCFVRSTELCFLARHAPFAERSETKNHKNLNNSIWSTMGSKPSTPTCFSHNLERFGKREKNSVKRKKRYPLPKFCTHTHTLS